MKSSAKTSGPAIVRSSYPKTRREAELAGNPYYFTGKPCKHGHVSVRKTSNGNCRACVSENNNRAATKNGKYYGSV